MCTSAIIKNDRDIRLRAFFLHHSASFPWLISKSLQGEGNVGFTSLQTTSHDSGPCHYNPLLCPGSEIFWLISTELAGWLSVAGLKPKRIWQRIKSPCWLLFSYSLVREVIFTLSVHDVMSSCRAVCIRKLQVKDIQFPRIIWWFCKAIILKRGLLNRICGFHLVIERNGYFVYFFFCCTDIL